MSQRFNTAAEVKRYLKEWEFTEKVRVKCMDSPFSGGGRFFWVSLPEREGIVTVSNGESRKPTTFAGFAGTPGSVEKAGRLNELQSLLVHTNAFPVQEYS
jgi:hypothetical protein